MHCYNCEYEVEMYPQLGLSELKAHKAQEELAEEEGERFCPGSNTYQT